MNPMVDTELLAQRQRPTRQRIGLVLAAVAALIALGVLTSAFRGPAFVESVTVVNESPFDLHVAVRGEDGAGGVLGLGTVPRGRSVEYRSVLDQGDTWSISFTGGGEQGGTVDVARSTLERDGWNVTVPAVVTQRLERAGLRPSAETRAG
jgi:hypothetical protein